VDDLSFFIGNWLARAEDPSSGRTFSIRYRVELTLDGQWLSGSGESPEMGVKVHDLWGHDPVTGEVLRVIFDSQGTFGMVRSNGWKGEVLVFEGEARGREGAVPVRETITRLGPSQFKAVWEARSETGWAPYSIEHLERKTP
jgi:hypothetical protein